MEQQETQDNQEFNKGIATGFVQGNLESWHYLASVYMPKAMDVIVKTIDPIIYGALIELLGSNNRFEKKVANIYPILNENMITAFKVSLQYNVPDFVNPDCEPTAVEHDRKHIMSKCLQVKSVQWNQKSITIDINTGIVAALFVIPVGIIGRGE